MGKFRDLQISDEALAEVNAMFDWRAAAPLPDGRLLGRMHEQKRPFPEPIPDPRILRLNKFIPLRDKTVLEVGCFEGIHTIGLCTFAKSVTAIDLRPVNVSKTLTRLSLHGAAAEVFVADCEKVDRAFGAFDVIFHFGVLYHMRNPVEHIFNLAGVAGTIFLDTHVSPSDAEHESETIRGEIYDYVWVREGGWSDPFSGAHETSKHLSLESLEKALKQAGYKNVRLMQMRDERSGPRVLLLASRSHPLHKVKDIRDEIEGGGDLGAKSVPA